MDRDSGAPIRAKDIVADFSSARTSITQFSIRSQEVKFSTPNARLSGTLLVPPGRGPVDCAVLVGGTLSHTRDGYLHYEPAPPRDALKRLARSLALGGFASLRYDKPGFGLSTGLDGWQGTYRDMAGVVRAAIAAVRNRRKSGRVFVIGESAGAYAACMAAEEGAVADGYVFLGALCGDASEHYDYNFGELARYAGSSPERLDWAMLNARADLALGRSFRAMLEAAGRGDTVYTIEDGEYSRSVSLVRRREELRWPPHSLFPHITTPALVLAGEFDRNVPPAHARRAAELIREAGNTDAQWKIIPGADHSFQEAPDDPDVRFRERYTLASLTRPYVEDVYTEILDWLARHFPADGGREPNA